MAQVDTPGLELRIFCICGQKMRVSSTMFGRPGKCIACRQKIRIPRLDEIPDDTSEIYLKDHPEFIRKVQPKQQFSEVDRAQEQPAIENPDTGDDADDVSLGEAAPDGPVVPLDPLEPLRVLCSLEEKVAKEIAQAKRSATSGGMDHGTLVRYRALIRNARSAFDDKLRDRLVEATEQLSGVKELLARAAMSVRVGETDYGAYQDKVTPLRAQRDRWERRIQNLRGWLATSDAAVAGGYLDVRLEDVPVEPEDVVFAADARPSAVLLDQHIETLRAAMRERAAAERRLAEWQRIERERALGAVEIEVGRRESEAIRKRAAAEVAFVRGRLEQAAQDTELDNRAIKSYLDALRGRLQGGEIDAGSYKATESRLSAAQNNNTNARELARRALAANSPADIPRPSSTLMQRLAAAAQAPGGGGLGLDSWFAWGAAVAMVLNILVPIARQQPAGNLVSAPGLTYGLFTAAAVLALIALVPKRPLRAALLNVTWVAICIGGAGYLHELWHGAGPAGVAMRSDPSWFTSPGLILFALCGMLTGLAAAVSVLPFNELRRVPAMAAGTILIALGLILTDLFGTLSAQPSLSEPTSKVSTERPGVYEVRIDLANNGWRAQQFGGDLRMVASPATFLVERRIGQDSWEDVTLRQLSRMALSGQLDGRATGFPSVTLYGGERVSASYYLEPGTYRARIVAPGGVERVPVRNFTLVDLPESGTSEVSTVDSPVRSPELPPTPAPAPSAPVTNKEAASAPLDAPAPVAEPAAPSRPEGVDVVLQGVINAAGRDPRFIVGVTVPGEEPRRDYTALGDTIFGKWKAAEFNPENQALTVSDGERLLVLERGQPVFLEGGAAESPAAERTPVPGDPAITPPAAITP